MRDFVTFEVGPFTVQVGYDPVDETYFGQVFEGRRDALPSAPCLAVGSADMPLRSVEGLRLALRDETFDFGSQIPPTIGHDLVAWKQSGKPDVADWAELD